MIFIPQTRIIFLSEWRRSARQTATSAPGSTSSIANKVYYYLKINVKMGFLRSTATKTSCWRLFFLTFPLATFITGR